jgi:hypothetical protein
MIKTHDCSKWEDLVCYTVYIQDLTGKISIIKNGDADGTEYDDDHKLNFTFCPYCGERLINNYA